MNAAGDTLTTQQRAAIAMGSNAGFQNQGAQCVAIGVQSGQYDQGLPKGNSIAIGTLAGQSKQSPSAIAIGDNAAVIGQGDVSIAIGAFAGNGAVQVQQFSNSIVINASGGKQQSLTTGTTHINPIRLWQYDTVLTYDDVTYSQYDPNFNPTNQIDQRYEVVNSVFSMPLYTWYPPQDPINNDPEYRSYSFTAISETFPWISPLIPSGNIICQTNQYEYYLYDCNLPPPLGTLVPLLTGFPLPTCVYNNLVSVVGCQGYVLLAYDPAGGYNYAAQFSGYWNYNNGLDPPQYIQCSWAATLQWLKYDPRAVYTDPNTGTRYRIMPLVANHTV